MKKGFLFVIAISLFLCSSVNVFAKNEIEVFVSIANGDLKIAYEKIAVYDTDEDGVLTIDDALYCAHELKYKGESKGYISSEGPFGTKIDMLWGVDNGGSYGYYINNSSAMSLDDAIKNHDHIYAFVYTDLSAYSDTFSFFDKQKISTTSGESFLLNLSSLAYDESWNIVSENVKDAYITINGEKTEIKTNEKGNAVLTLDKKGKYIISAVSENQVLIPSVCIVNVTESDMTATPSDKSSFVYVILSLASFVLISATVLKAKKI